MKKILAWIMMFALLFGAIHAGAEEADKYDKLTVATTTAFNGNFFSPALGSSNSSDLDVQHLIHGYSLVYWDSGSGSYQFNKRLVSAVNVSADGTSYTFALTQGLKYSNGTPITAKDYAFSLLLQGSSALKEAAGARANITHILGGKDYQEGITNTLAGFRILSDYLFTLTIDPDYIPYFYQLKAMDVSPLPVAEIAPGCEILDDGEGAYIDGPFRADVLQQTLTDPNTGYASHPDPVSGPYMLTSYDGTKVELELNPEYIGNVNGVKPTIPKIIYQVEDPETVMNSLATGRVDLVVRCARQDQITTGMGLAGGGDFAMTAYSRSGLGFISFCTENSPTADVNVRQAVSMCLDKATLTQEYLGSYGTTVNGFYGIGQWMFMMANRTLVPEEGHEEEWADLTLENIPIYPLDPEGAASLLELAGWEMDADGIRYKEVNGERVPLKLKLIYSKQSGAGELLEQTFEPYLNQAGIELELKAVDTDEMLKQYYSLTERDCDMILLGTNFGDVYDPSGEYDAHGKNLYNGITDPELAQLAVSMRSTEPGNAPEYCRRWLAYQQRLAATAAEIPIYSNAYLDFHLSALRNYEPGKTGSWSYAITEAYLSDFAEEEVPEDEGEVFE